MAIAIVIADKIKQKRCQKEQNEITKKLKQVEVGEKVELAIKKTKSMKEDLRKLFSQLEEDFEYLMSKAAEEKKSVKAVSFK